jgi:hypothetical protein
VVVKRYVIGMLCVAITACAVPTPKGPPKTASEVMNAAVLTPRDGAGAIVVIRDTFLRDLGCTYEVSLDGQLVAGLRNGEQVTVYANPGPRALGVSIRPTDDCEPAAAQVPVNVVASATTKIRVSGSVRYDLKLEATTY